MLLRFANGIREGELEKLGGHKMFGGGGQRITPSPAEVNGLKYQCLPIIREIAAKVGNAGSAGECFILEHGNAARFRPFAGSNTAAQPHDAYLTASRTAL